MLTNFITAEAQTWDLAFSVGADPNNGNARTEKTATDAQGNTYVVGDFQGTVSFGTHTITSASPDNPDVFVAKASPDGHWLWAVTGGGASNDAGNGIALDAAGNAYITGSLRATATFGKLTATSTSLGSDAFVAKLGSDGQWLWLTTSGGMGAEAGTALGVDAAGNIYLAGEYSSTPITFGSFTLEPYDAVDVFVARLDPAGQWQWATRAGGPSNDYADAMTVDAAGNAYLTGQFLGKMAFGTALSVSGGRDVYVAKINSEGQWQWATQAGGTNNDYANGITLDPAGNVYTTGWFSGNIKFGTTATLAASSPGGVNFYVAKLNAGGKWQWATRTAGTGSDTGTDIVADAQGHLFVAGEFSGAVSFGATQLSAAPDNQGELFVARLSAANGQWQWATQATGHDEAESTSLGLDATGNLYLGGWLRSTDAVFGTAHLAGPGPGLVQTAYLAKLNNASTFEWAVQSDAGGEKLITSMVTDASGHVYVAGTFAGVARFGTTVLRSELQGNQAFVAKLTASGQCLWAVQAGSAGYDIISGLALDAAGDLVVTGSVAAAATFGTLPLAHGTEVQDDLFVAKLSAATGAWRWVTSGGGSGRDRGNALTTDAAGNIYLTGYFQSPAIWGSLNLTTTLNGDNVLVAKLDASGNWLWASAGGSYSPDAGNAIAVDAAGNTYITGVAGLSSSFGNLTLKGGLNPSAFVAKLAASGQWVWATETGVEGQNIGYGLSLDASGNVYVTGSFKGTMMLGETTLQSSGLGDLYVAKLTPNGQWAWAVQATNNGQGNETGRALALDAAGNVYVTGRFAGTKTTFGAQTITAESASVFVAQLDATGQWQWAVAGGGSWLDASNALAFSPDGHLYIAGEQSSPRATFGTHELAGGRTFFTGFVARLGDLDIVTANQVAARPGQVQAFPNPFGRELQVQLPAGAITLAAYDALGRRCWQRSLSKEARGGFLSVPEASAWPAGVYLLTVRQGSYQQVIRVMHQ
ncbi:SBBP repeat-containing protein [Hymenobacter guriensis]|uniref:SBBP repeat-containing protein n=1 Tax=Hymenobacter guriensis TaxID=2793065 RepID=A0ABS0L477_9BACT|nr:SBBP repeat-containing protein [Hymenobacter guriensis]MBG8554353.1 SBBP repeat-containing protein [Hymenobacter guriensis]